MSISWIRSTCLRFCFFSGSCSVIFRGISQYWRHWHYIDRGRGGEGRPSQEVRLSKCQQKCQHVAPRYFGQQVRYKSIRQIQRPAKSLRRTSMSSISPIQIFNDQLVLAEWCFSKQNAHSSMRSFNITNEFILSTCDSEQIHYRKRCSNAL